MLLQQAKAIAEYYQRDSRVANYRQRHPKVSALKALIKAIPAREVIKAHSNKLWCYSPEGEIIRFGPLLVEGAHVLLYRGWVETGEPVIIKWYSNPNRRKDTEYENDIYRRLGYPDPCWSVEHQVWGTPVLIMEPLLPLDRSDDPYKVGIAILNQLPDLHQFGCHNDIKPGNIMKRKIPGRDPEYILIDYGGCAIIPYHQGYRRWIWSPKWTSQPRRSENGGREVITFPKYDFIELGYTMKNLYNDRKGISESVRSGFRGRLSKYMKLVKALPDTLSISPQLYQQLIQVLTA